MINGTAEWSETRVVNGVNGYRLYATTAETSDLCAGGSWSNTKNWPHIQARKTGSPVIEGLTVQQIDVQMKKRFG